VNAQGIACGPITRTTNVSEAAFVSVLVLLAAFAIVLGELWLAAKNPGRAAMIGLPGGRTLTISTEATLVVTLAGTLLIILGVLRIFSSDPVFTLSVQADEIAIVALLALAAPAWLVLHARDSRRFALGIIAAATVWFVAWYPNLAGLPLQNSIANVWQGLLPTWNYDFQFAVNLDPPVGGGITDGATWVVLIVAVILSGIAVVAAQHWRGLRVSSADRVVAETT